MKRKLFLKIGLIVFFLAGFVIFVTRDQNRSRLSDGSNNSEARLDKTAPPLTAPPLLQNPVPDDDSLEKMGSAWSDKTGFATARFADWWQKYETSSAQEKVALEDEGMMAASERRDFLKELIQTDPERALELAIPFSVRRELPDSVQELLEERISGRGELAVLAAIPEPGGELDIPATFRTANIGGREFKAFVYGRRLGEPTKRDIPLNGIAIGNLFAANENPVRILEAAEVEEIDRPSEALCAISEAPTLSRNDETVVEVGDEIIFLCARAHADELNKRIIAESDVSESAYTEGEKKLLLIRVDFPDLVGVPFSDATGTNLISGMNTFYRDCSYNRASFTLAGQGSDYTPTFRMPTNASYYGTNDLYNLLRTHARAAATSAGYVLTNYNFDVICMGLVPGWTWGGLGYVGQPGSWVRSSTFSSHGVMAHEVGHNYGLNHANWWNTYGLSIIGTTGTNVEYGDNLDTMGAASAGNNQFNARYKRYLNWLTASEVTNVTVSGTYRIFCHDNTNSTGLRAISTHKTGTATNYWIEFRQKFTANKWSMSGVGIRWAHTNISNNGKSLLLDTTPGTSTTVTTDKNDGALVIGRTLSDKQAGIHITPIGKGGTTPESIDVVVNRGTFPTNVPPTITIFASATNVAAGATVNFTSTASDANGDALAYYWDFGNTDFGTNGPAASKSWSAGEYVVRCTVTDMKGGIASDSIIIRVGSPTTFRISGKAMTNSTPVEGVRIFVPSSNRFTYTDSDGTYNLVGLTAGTYTVNAQLDGYTFYPSTFSNPVSVGPNKTEIDFNATAIVPPAITVQPQNKFVAAGTNVTFSVTATGDSLAYRWRSNGVVIANATNASLTLNNVQLNHAANYSVVVSNIASSVISSNAALVVNVPPVITAISNQTVSEHALLSFAVLATDPGAAIVNTFADFESFQNGASSVMFRIPNFSSTTSANLDSSPNTSAVTTNVPSGISGSVSAINVNWSFKTGITNPWLRLTTSDATGIPNPTVHFGQKLRFNIRSDKSLKVGVGLRETGTSANIGANGGTSGTIEYAGVTNVIGGFPYPARVISPNVWTTLEFDFPNEPTFAFTGNGVLESASGKGVLEHLVLMANAGSGAYNVYLDNFAVVDPGTLTFTLEPGAPAGASIHPQTGIFSWTPTELQGPGDYNITVRVTDNGTPALNSTNSFSVTVAESNSAPVLTAISNRFVNAGATVVFTNIASDADFPANVLNFSFGSNAPAGATVGSSSGIFNWTAPDSEILLTNSFEIFVTDNGIPPLNDSKSFDIIVVPPPKISSVEKLSDGSTTLTWQTFPGKTYRVQYKNSLEDPDWTNHGEAMVASDNTLSITDNLTGAQPQRFYRILQMD